MSTSNKEIRSVNDQSAQPKLSDDGKTITGYAAVFNSFSQDLGGFYEIIRPGAFDRSIAAGADVRGLVDHDSGKVLGRTKSGTLKLSVDQRGLKYEITPPDTTAARDLMVSMKRGDIDGSSFAFSTAPNGDKWRKEGDKTVRDLHDVDLFDVSVVTYPAYLAAQSSLRSLVDFTQAQAKEQINIAEQAVNRYDVLRRRLQLIEKEF